MGWKAAVVLFVLFGAALGASVGARSAPRCSASPAAQDLRYVREYRHLLKDKADAAWPGWKDVPPLLQRSGRCEFLVGLPSPPKSFHPTLSTVGGWKVYAAAAGTVTPGPVAATWKVGTTWVAMVPTRAEFQRVVDRQLGRGVISLTDTSYVRALVHEAFHAHQMTTARGSPPAFGGSLEQEDAVALLGPVGAVESRLAGEGRALASALEARSLSAARARARVFAARRADRRRATGDPRGLTAYERQVEWSEGSARYADLRLVLLASGRGYTPTEGIHYTSAAASRRAFIADLVNPKPRVDGLRGRWEDLGAAEALLLDRLSASWHDDLLTGRSALESLLAEGVRVATALADLRVAKVAVDGRRFRVALAERAEQWRRGLSEVSDIRPLDGLLFRFGKDVSPGFTMAGAAMPLDIAFFDRGGRLLGVQTMTRCSAEPCRIYRAPAPFRDALEAPAETLGSLRVGSRLVTPGR